MLAAALYASVERAADAAQLDMLVI